MQTFEARRLQLFRDSGFLGRGIWMHDPRLDFRTYAIRRGDGPCPTVLIHGGMAEASVWYRLAPYLDGPVVIPDRPGHGLSGDIDYTGIDYAAHAVAWLDGVVEALGLAQVDLVGNSMGGYFAIVYALARPSRVRSLVLAGAPAGVDRKLPRFIHLWRMPITGHAIGAAIRRTRDPEQIRRRGLGSMCTHPERVSDRALEVQALSTDRPRWNATIRSMLRACSDFGGWRKRLSIRDAMATLEVPTLFAWGDRDSFSPPSSGQAIAEHMANARVEVLYDAGHLPQLDQPEALAAAIRRFQTETAWRPGYGADAPTLRMRVQP